MYKNTSNNTVPEASLSASKADIGYFELDQNGKILIHGFHSLVGKKFVITVLLDKIIFSPYDENSDDIPATTFTEENLNTKAMYEFLADAKAFNTLFVRFVSNWFEIPGAHISSVN